MPKNATLFGKYPPSPLQGIRTPEERLCVTLNVDPSVRYHSPIIHPRPSVRGN